MATTSMRANAELERIFQRLQSDYYKLNEEQQRFAVRELQRIQTQISEMLAEHTGPDGKISRQRWVRISQELAQIEAMLFAAGEVVMNDVVAESAEFTTAQLNLFMQQSFGTTLTAGAAMEAVNNNTVDYVMKRFYDDGLVLSDRVWSMSASVRDSIEQTIRTGIITGQSVSELVPAVRQAYDAETWQIRRLVVTEGSTAYRTATAMVAEQSDVVEWVQIHRGEAENPRHECSKLAAADPYGMGPGIYKPTDMEIYNPHPNCTSFLTYIVDDAYTLEGLRRRFGGDDA